MTASMMLDRDRNQRGPLGGSDRDSPLIKALRLREPTAAEGRVATFDENGRHAGPLVDWSSRIDDPAVQTELRAVLSSALSELPAHYRAVVVMHDVEGWSMAEIANCLGITVATAKTRAHRARLLLRQRLSIFMTGQAAPLEAA